MAERPLALLGGRLLPDPGGEADSILIVDGRIAAVDTERRIRETSPPQAELVDVGERWISPGFHDAHFHFLQTGLKAARPSLRGCRSLEDLLDATADAVTRNRGRRPLVLEDWDQNQWAEPRMPTRSDLDRVVPDHPVILRRVDDHTAVANDAGLARLADVWPEKGWESGDGLVREGPIRHLESLFPPTAEELLQAFATCGRICHSIGVTTTTDFLTADAVRHYRDHLRDHELPVRVSAYAVDEGDGPGGPLEELPSTDRFRLAGTKIFADGSIGGRTAALFEGYDDDPENSGLLVHEPSRLRSMIARGHDSGRQVAVHAIGDRAIAVVLDAFEALPPDEVRARGHRMEHVELPRARDVDRLARLGVRPCPQPNFVGQWAAPGGLYERALGPERLRRMNPIGTLLRAGARPFFGSDGMPASPLFGIRSALRHPVEDERLTFEEAHRLYTVEAADAVVPDRLSARLEVGRDGDLVVLSGVPQDPPERDEEWIALTVLAGRIVHEGLLSGTAAAASLPRPDPADPGT